MGACAQRTELSPNVWLKKNTLTKISNIILKLISEDSNGSILLLLADIYRSVGLLRRSASLRTQSGAPYEVLEASREKPWVPK